MSLRLRSYFVGIATADGVAWDDIWDSIPMFKSEVADGASAVASYVDTTTNWTTSGSKLFSFRNNGVEKAYVDRGGAVVGSSFSGDGSALTSLVGTAIASGLVGTTYGGTGLDAHVAANGKLLIGNGAGFALATLTAGSGISIANGAGTITITSTSSASPSGATGRYQVNDGAGGLASGSLIDAETNKAVAMNTATSAFPCWRLADSGSVGWVSCLGDFSDRARFDCGSFSMGTGDPRSNAADCFLTRAGARTFQLGGADSATPLSQAIKVQGARGGTDTNTAGGSLSISSGTGTGSGAASLITFNVPVVGSTGTTAQVMLAALTLTSSAFSTAVPVRVTLGSVTSAISNYVGTATWNDSLSSFVAIDLQITDTASATGSLLQRLSVSGVDKFTVDKAGLVYGVKFKFGTGTTGAGTPLFGTNCPAVTVTAPYTWITAISSDGSTVFIPAWK